MLTFPTSTPTAAASRGVASSVLGKVTGILAAVAGTDRPGSYRTGAAIRFAIRGLALPA